MVPSPIDALTALAQRESCPSTPLGQGAWHNPARPRPAVSIVDAVPPVVCGQERGIDVRACRTRRGVGRFASLRGDGRRRGDGEHQRANAVRLPCAPFDGHRRSRLPALKECRPLRYGLNLGALQANRVSAVPQIAVDADGDHLLAVVGGRHGARLALQSRGTDNSHPNADVHAGIVGR